MKDHIRDIITGLLITIVLIAGIIYFYQSIQAGKKAGQLNLHTLIASDPEIVFRLNRPQVVSSLILSHKQIEDLFLSSIPEVFLSLIKHSSPASSPLLSVHPQGILFYTKAEGKDLKTFEQQVFNKHFPSYPPSMEKKNGISCFFYPDTANHFFGYYHHEGILVAGYNFKLLEEVAVRQKNITNNPTIPLSTDIHTFDDHAPMNLFLSTAKFDFHFPVNDSVTWHSQKEWFITDIFSNEGKICCFSSFEASDSLDSLSLSLASDTLSRQLEKFFPALRIESQIFQEDKLMNYIGCTINPS